MNPKLSDIVNYVATENGKSLAGPVRKIQQIHVNVTNDIW